MSAAGLKLGFLDPAIHCVGDADTLGHTILADDLIDDEILHPQILIVDVLALKLRAAIQRAEPTAREVAEFIGIAPAPTLQLDT